MRMLKNNNWVYDPPVSAVRSSQKRIFVYALLLPAALTSGNIVPFYIGITSQLNKRLANHKEINWFSKRFNHSVTVKVLGTAAEDDAFNASQELVRLLLTNKYYIAAHNPYKTPYIKKLTDDDIIKYAKNREDFNNIIETWKTSFNIKTLSEGKKKPQSEKPPVGQQAVKKEKLISVCGNLNYGSQTEKNIVLNIAYEYDDSLGYSKYWLSSSDINFIKRNPKNKIRKIFSFPQTGWGTNHTFFRVQPSFITKHF